MATAQKKNRVVTANIEADADLIFPHTWEPGTFTPMKPFKSSRNLELNIAYGQGRADEREFNRLQIERLEGIVSTLHMRLTGKYAVPEDPEKVIDCR
jgi:hypothetical protein